MNFSIFAWLRRKTAEAFAAGTADYMAAITPEGEEVPASLEELRALIGRAVQPKALPAAEDEPAKKGRGK